MCTSNRPDSRTDQSEGNPLIGGWTPGRRLTRVVEHADSGYLRGPRTRGQRKAAKRQQNRQNW